jgi:hypothetical protein
MPDPNPAYVQCAKDLAACETEPVGLRAWCRANVSKRCQGVPPTLTEATIDHSRRVGVAPAGRSIVVYFEPK